MSNHLVNETSPYLLQHANNPVDWYPWGEEALSKARREDKPILLSIGYSACHWCHVMAHESFEDEETAKLMNQLFVNIKVDREERPDLDKIYQTAYQLINQKGGGWPLTVFLTPDQQAPFFIGTYFPKVSHYQLPAFKDLLRYLAQIYQQKKSEIAKNNIALLSAFDHIMPKYSKEIHFSTTPIAKGIDDITHEFDRVNGGFGAAPKFPQTNYLELLLRQYVSSNEKDNNLLSMIETTLLKMSEGGIYDQLGGGFFRYSVDAEWRIPHFEKMLYDNVQLLNIYAETYALTHQEKLREIAIEPQHGSYVRCKPRRADIMHH